MNANIVYSNMGAVVLVKDASITASVPFDFIGNGELNYTAKSEGAVGSPREALDRRKEFIRIARRALLLKGHTVLTPAWVDC